MKKGSIVLAGAFLATLTLGAASHASVIAQDSFDYPAGGGALANQNGGTGWSGTWGNGGNNIVSPGLTYSKNGSTLLSAGNSAETVGGGTGNFRFLPNTVSTGTVYVSFLGKLDSGTPGTNYAGVSLFNGGENLFIGEPGNQTNWGVDQSTGLHTTNVPVDGDTHLFVVQIDFGAATDSTGNDRVRMYVDPMPGVTSPDVAASLDLNTTRSASFNEVRIQSGGDQVAFDELRIGDTYADVVPAPEPATLGLLGLAGAGVLIRRRRGARAQA